MLYRYLDVIDIFIDHFCKNNQQKAMLVCVKELLLCYDPKEWGRLNPRQRRSWVSKHLPQAFHKNRREAV